MEDKEIIRLYFERNEDAVRLTRDKYGKKLRSIAFGITEDAGAAEECENDTYLEAWERIPPNEPVNWFFAYLAKIVRHISIDRIRKQASLKRQVYLSELSDELLNVIPAVDDVEHALEAKELSEAINRFLGSLPDEKRILFVRRYFFLDTIAEIGKRMNISESKVKTTLFRIRSELRRTLKEEGYTV